METDNPSDRHQVIAAAIAAELQRQAVSAVINVAALAAAVDDALVPDLVADEGKRPDELNATNDD